MPRLTAAQLQRLVTQLQALPVNQARELLAAVRRPDRVADIPGLAERLGLGTRYHEHVGTIVADLLTHQPGLLDRPGDLARRVTERYRTAESAVQGIAATPVYAGVFLDQPSRRRLLGWFTRQVGAVLPEVLAHHCTVCFGPTGPVNTLAVGAPVTLEVVGAVDRQGVQAVVVRGVETDNPVAHVTVAVQPPRVPRDSNDVLAQGYRALQGPRLTGTLGYYDGQDIVTAGKYRALHLYDFDGTLFRSPFPPDSWGSGMGDWWDDPRGLGPPCVPETPGSDWWVGPTVKAARQSIRDPGVYAIVCTGRSYPRFRRRVPELLRQAGLGGFDEVLLKPSANDSTLPFKQNVMRRLHAKHQFESIEIWEDRHTDRFEAFIKSLGLDGQVHRIRNAHNKPLCDSLD